MESKEELQNEINDLTNKLRREKPAVYEHLMEVPDTVPNEQDDDSDNFRKLLKDYRNQLIELINKVD